MCFPKDCTLPRATLSMTTPSHSRPRYVNFTEAALVLFKMATIQSSIQYFRQRYAEISHIYDVKLDTNALTIHVLVSARSVIKQNRDAFQDSTS